MLAMETKSQKPIVNSLPSNAAGSSNEHPHSGAHIYTSVVAPLDSMAQTGHAKGDDWQEEACQELKAIKEKLESYEKQILDFINTNGARNPVASLQQGQLPLPHVHSMHQPESPITKMQSHENQMNPQLQSMNLQGSVSSLDSTAQTGHANGGDWQEEVYQKIKAMKEMYLPEINEMHQKIATKLQQYDSRPQQPKSDQLEKLKMFRTMLERIITFLQVPKSSILPNFKEKLGSYEKQILNFINTHKPSKPISSLHYGQTGHANGGDWQEEVYQKIKAMKEMYLPEINEMHQKIATKLQQYDSLPQQPKSDQLEKLKMFRTMLERIITFLQVPKSSILPNFKEKLGSYEKQILNFINTNKPSKPISSLHYGQTGHANGGDWQEEVYQKIKAMKEMYLPEINEMHQKIATKLQQYDSLPQQPKSDQLEKLKMFRTMLERIITFLQVPKSSILPNFKEKLGPYEKQILNFINANKPRKPVSSPQQGQLPPPHMHSMQQPQSQIT